MPFLIDERDIATEKVSSNVSLGDQEVPEDSLESEAVTENMATGILIDEF